MLLWTVLATAASSIKTGDVLVLQAAGGDVTLNLANNTSGNQVVSVGSQKFNVTIAADGGNQVLTIASVNDASSGTNVGAAEAATVAEFDAVLDALKFNNTENASPVVGDRVFAVSANDGTMCGAAATVTVTVAATDDTPTVSIVDGTPSFTESQGSHAANNVTVINNAITLADLDTAVLKSATVEITNVQAGDVLALDTSTHTKFDATLSGGVLTIAEKSGQTASTAELQAALRDVTFANTTDTPDNTARTIEFKVSDGNSTSTAATESVAVTATNDIPSFTFTDGNPAFTEDQGAHTSGNATVINSSFTAGDLDGSIASAEVKLTNAKANDALLFTDTAKIKGAIVDGTGVKTLTLTPVTGETPTPAEFAAALSSVKFANTSEAPDATARSIEFKVTDNEGQASTVLTESVAVSAVNDTPVVDLNGAATGGNKADTFTEVDGNDDGCSSGILKWYRYRHTYSGH